MLHKMLAASVTLLLVVGLTHAGEKKKGDKPVHGKFVKFDAEKNEITIKVKKNEQTFAIAKDAKVELGDGMALKDLQPNDRVALVTKTDSDNNTIVVEVKRAQGKKGSGSGSASKGSGSESAAPKAGGTAPAPKGSGSASKGS